MNVCTDCVWCKTHIDHQNKTGNVLMNICSANIGITIISDDAIADKCDGYDDDSWVK